MLKGEKVYLCEIDSDNIEWMRNQRNNPEMRKYFREWKDITKDQQKAWYESRGNNTSDSHVYFEIHCLDSDTLIGCLGLHYIQWEVVRSAEFGIFLSETARGKGFAKESMTLMLDQAFFGMNLNRVFGEVYDNNPAIGFYRHIGFVDEGLLRHTYYKDGKYGNSHMISILQDEWAAFRGRK